MDDATCVEALTHSSRIQRKPLSSGRSSHSTDVAQKESTISKKVVDMICHWDCGWAYKRRGGPGRRGEPDVSGCVMGIRVELECKRPGNDKGLTRLQKHQLEKWKRAGAITGVFHSVEEARKIIHDELARRGLMFRIVEF